MAIDAPPAIDTSLPLLHGLEISRQLIMKSCGEAWPLWVSAHLAGMLVNVVSQMLGIHALDHIPAMFLGL